eukprot:scaffold1686_cov371-Prasinococcus_capsulatus_cf.AAC.1
MDADLFELGGNSLLAGRAAARIRVEMKVPSLVTTQLYNTKLCDLATYIAEHSLLPDQSMNSKSPRQTEIPMNGLDVSVDKANQQPRRSWTNPLCFCLQTVGVILSPLFGELSVVIAFLLLAYIYSETNEWITILLIPPLFVLYGLTTMCTLVLIKWALIWKYRVQTIEMWSLQYVRWWFVHIIFTENTRFVFPLLFRTEVLNMYLRLLGAKIGNRVEINTEFLGEFDLLRFHDGVTLQHHSIVRPRALDVGVVHMKRIEIGTASQVGTRAVVEAGARVPANSVIQDHSVSSRLVTRPGQNDEKPEFLVSATFFKRQQYIRVCVGLPALAIVHAIPFVPIVFLLPWLYDEVEQTSELIFWAILPWVILLVHPITHLLTFVAVKRIIIGKFQEGDASSQFEQFRSWFMERMIVSPATREAFELADSMGPAILATVFRGLGMQVGKRTRLLSSLHIIETDLTEIGNDVVMGQGLVVKNLDAQLQRCRVVVEDGSDMLDFVTIQAGAYLEHDCLLGSFAVAGEHSRVFANSVLVGIVEGSADPSSPSASSESSSRYGSEKSASSAPTHAEVLRDGTAEVRSTRD